MLRLLVLLMVVVYCNSCSLDVPNDGTTDAPDCYDSEGNSHPIYSEWSTDTERCVCSTLGTLCCPSFNNVGDWEKWYAEHFGGYLHGSNQEHEYGNQVTGVTDFIAY
ncbi:beta-microseminoprotein-like [Triplophysa dalaica]|uniref:beta-microseminoprotein-like n=1 Tax=Triplophysa dalaica TaxID=1582913 RepID=UPI0024DFCED2|nr:beta-microseminoprotein-like [Triplophysa dalaica]